MRGAQVYWLPLYHPKPVYLRGKLDVHDGRAVTMGNCFSFIFGRFIERNRPGVGEVPISQPVEGESRARNPQEEPGIHVLIDKTLYQFYGPRSSIPPKIQIVFFHGLERGDSNKAYLETWKSSDGSTLWPKSWLGEDFKNARILSVSYDSSMKKGPHMGRLDLHCTAESLIQDLKDVGVGVAAPGSCPIVMVGKDLGCLVIQAVCVHASDTFLSNLRGLFFYCPPTMGVPGVSKALDGDLAQKLRTGDEEVSRIVWGFWKLRDKGRWKVTVMNAAHAAPGRQSIIDVPESSARPGADVYYTAKEDILSICRPASNKSSSYIKLKKAVSECLASKCQVHQCQGLPPRPVGLMECAKEAENKLSGTCVLGIFGMGGIGKTTLAKQLFNNISWRFEYTCFAEDVKDFIPTSSLEDHVKHRFYRSGKLIQSIEWIELAGKKILLVMDDIDSEEQLRLIPSLRSMGEGSVIILTTRNQEVLKYFDECIRHEVDFLDAKEAERLFCENAFRQNNIPESLSTNVRAYAQDVITKCDGLPLTLEVLGAYLHNHETDPAVWIETIRRLGNADSIGGSFNDRVWSKLKVSYDTLTEGEKEMFIDIAVFFVGKPLETVLAACSTGHGNPNTRWNNLVSRCLVKSKVTTRYKSSIGDFLVKTVWMHEHLQDLGNKLCSHASVVVSGGGGPFSAPLINPNVEVVLLSEEDDTVTLQVRKDAQIIPRYYCLADLTFNLPKALFQHIQCLDLQSVSFQGFSHALPSNLRFLRWINKASDIQDLLRPLSRIPFPIELAKMEKLAVLELSGFKTGQPMQFPKELCSLKLDNIKGLDSLPEDLGSLPSLKFLELSNLAITALPESLGDLSSLVTLEVTYCENLNKLPKSFGSLTSLQALAIGSVGWSDGVKLQTLPDSFGHLPALMILYICAPDLESLPDSFELLTCLQDLRLSTDKMHALPQNFGQLHSLIRLELLTPKLLSLPDSLPLLKTLQDVEIHSRELHKLPDDFGQLHALSRLILHTPKLLSLPDSIGGLTSLKTWTLRSHFLTKVPESIGELSSLQEWTLVASSPGSLPETMGGMTSLERLALEHESSCDLPESLGQLSSLSRLDLSECWLPDGMENLMAVRDLTLKGFGDEALPAELGSLTSLQKLAILDFNCLRCLPEELGSLSSLQELFIKKCPSLETLPEELGGLSSLQELVISYCPSLESLPEELGDLSSLQELVICDCPNLESLPEELSGLSSLRRLTILSCHNLRQLPKSLGSGKGHERRREEGTDDSVGSRARQEMILAIGWCKGLTHDTVESFGWTKDAIRRDEAYEVVMKRDCLVAYLPTRWYRRR